VAPFVNYVPMGVVEGETDQPGTIAAVAPVDDNAKIIDCDVLLEGCVYPMLRGEGGRSGEDELHQMQFKQMHITNPNLKTKNS